MRRPPAASSRHNAQEEQSVCEMLLSLKATRPCDVATFVDNADTVTSSRDERDSSSGASTSTRQKHTSRRRSQPSQQEAASAIQEQQPGQLQQPASTSSCVRHHAAKRGCHAMQTVVEEDSTGAHADNSQACSAEQETSDLSRSHSQQPWQLARPKPISPASALLGCALPAALLELATLAEQAPSRSQLAQDPVPDRCASLTPSASSAFTVIAALPKAKKQKHEGFMPMPGFPPDGMFPFLYMPGPGGAMLPCFPLMPHMPPNADLPKRTSSDSTGSTAVDVAGLSPSSPSIGVPALLPAARFDALKKAAARQASLARYLEKRKNRSFKKKVLYESRKRLAEARPRVRGQFVKAAPAPVLADA